MKCKYKSNRLPSFDRGWSIRSAGGVTPQRAMKSQLSQLCQPPSARVAASERAPEALPNREQGYATHVFIQRKQKSDSRRAKEIEMQSKIK